MIPTITPAHVAAELLREALFGPDDQIEVALDRWEWFMQRSRLTLQDIQPAISESNQLFDCDAYRSAVASLAFEMAYDFVTARPALPDQVDILH